jgi:lipoate-protein ligase A
MADRPPTREHEVPKMIPPPPAATAGRILVCHVLPRTRADGPANMALDHALLDHVASEQQHAFFRVYEWLRPTLSLGYFQRFQDALAELDAIAEVVRRPSGGGALWHDRDLTYCLVLPASHPATRPSQELYRKVHATIAELLHSLGVVVDQVRGGSARFRASRPFLCSDDRCEFDLVAGQQKSVGSAQRRLRGSVLQHGSIRLENRLDPQPRQGPAQPAAPAHLLIDQISVQLPEAVAAALGLHTTPGPIPDAIKQHARKLELARYRTLDWTRRR